MEINPSHQLIKKIAKESENGSAEDVKNWGSVLMGLASIADGEPVADGKEFTNLISKMLEK
jgi:molecular chaperone HtpG